MTARRHVCPGEGCARCEAVITDREDLADQYPPTLSVQLAVATVKPLPVPEPAAPLARIIDGKGVKRYYFWGYWHPVERKVERAVERAVALTWRDLPQPVTIIDADPDWGES